MATPVELPKSGNTVEECVIGRWVKQAGDAVSPGDVLAEVETDKATFEITAPVGGTLLATFFPEGALVPVFTTVCVIGVAGEDAEAFRPAAAAGTRESGFGIRREPERIPSPAPRIPTPEPRIPTSPSPAIPTAVARESTRATLRGGVELRARRHHRIGPRRPRPRTGCPHGVRIGARSGSDDGDVRATLG